METDPLADKLTFVMVGRSGCGKGTQARFLLERLRAQGVYHMETGRFLRALLEGDNPTVAIARRIMTHGQLFPEWFAVFTWLRELIESGHGGEHLVFDGAPRRLTEAKLLDEVLRWHGRPLPVCIYVVVSAKEATRRLLARGRGDDQTEAIKNRMRYFPRHVIPVIKYYRRHGRLVMVNGEQDPAAVTAEMGAALTDRLGAAWPEK